MSKRMDGRQQVEAYSKLVNSEQRAPASAAWQFGIGDNVMVRLGSDRDDYLIGRVVHRLPPYRVAVRTPRGLVVRVNAKRCRRL